MVPCRTLADTQGFGDALGVVAAGGEPQDLLGHPGAALGTGEGAGGEDQRQRYQRRNQGAARIESNTIRPRKALAWNRPSEVHQGPAGSINPNFPEPEIPPTT